MQIYSLFVAAASVSRCPDGFAAGLCALHRCGEPPWRLYLF